MPTLREYRRALAKEAGAYGLLTTTALGASADKVVCGGLISERPASAYDRRWLYIVDGASAGQQSQVSESGFQKTSGTLTVDTDFTAAIASGVAVEMYPRVPAFRVDEWPGWRELVNEALERLWTPDLIPMTAIANERKYTLDTATMPWLADKGRIVDLVDPAPDAFSRPVKSYRGWDTDIDGETAYLTLSGPYASGETFYLRVRRPALSLIRTASSWGTNDSDGLNSDTDEATSEVRHVVIVGMWRYYHALARMNTGGDQAAHAALASAWERRARRLKFYDLYRKSGVPELWRRGVSAPWDRYRPISG